MLLYAHACHWRVNNLFVGGCNVLNLFTVTVQMVRVLLVSTAWVVFSNVGARAK